MTPCLTHEKEYFIYSYADKGTEENMNTSKYKVAIRLWNDERFDAANNDDGNHFLDALRGFIRNSEPEQVKQPWPHDEDEIYIAVYNNKQSAEEAIYFLNVLGQHIFNPENMTIAFALWGEK